MNTLKDLRVCGVGYSIAGSREVNLIIETKWAQVFAFVPVKIRLVPITKAAGQTAADFVLLVDESMIPAADSAGRPISGLIPERTGEPGGIEAGVLMALAESSAFSTATVAELGH